MNDDVNGAPAGGDEGSAAPETNVLTSDRDIAAEIGRRRQAAQEQTAAGADTDDSGETETDPDGSADPGDGTAAPDGTDDDPSPAPPVAWSDEDKAWFKTLPPERQAAVAKRERELRQSESRRHNEHQAALKALQEHQQASATERQNLSAAISAFKAPLVQQFEAEFADLIKGETNALKIQENDPLRFTRLQAFEKEFGRVQAAERALADRHQAEQAAASKAFRDAENKALREKIPELAYDKAWAKFGEEITGYLREGGYDDAMIHRASARDLSIARKAMLWDRAQAKAREAEERAAKAKTAPKVMRPGGGADAEVSASESVKAARQQLARNPKSDAAVAAMLRAKRETRAN